MKNVFDAIEFEQFNEFFGFPESKSPYFQIYRLSEFKVDKDVVTPFYRQHFFDITLFRSSTLDFDYVYGKEKLKIKNATLQLVAPYQIQKLDVSYQTIKTLQGYTLVFKHDFMSVGLENAEFLKRFPFFKMQSDKNIFELSPSQEILLVNLMDKIYEEQNSSGIRSSEIVRGYIWVLLNECARIYLNNQSNNDVCSNHSSSELIADAFRELVELHFKSKNQVEEYARLLNISSNHLTQTIKETTGKNAKDFIAERRIAEAKRLLQYTNDSILEIAFTLNFSESSNFVKAFKKQTGLTPMEYRKLKTQ